MPNLPGQKERIQEPLWDTLIQGTPAAFTPRATIAGGPFVLFANAGAAAINVSNMDTPGALPGSQTYLLLAMRVVLHFHWCGVGGVGLVTPDIRLYHHAQLCLYWELRIDQKRYFVAPTMYLNAGGGLHGAIGNTTDSQFTNGTPGAKDIMTLDRPVPLTRQQPFQVIANVAQVGTVNLGNEIAALTVGEVDIKFILDGLKMRNAL